MATAGPGRSPMRERFREQVRDDVKAVALEQLATGGPAALSVNAIAKELGVSGPALYRYFANRDELLGELVVDTYHDFAAALAAAADRGLGLGPAQRLRALAGASRPFARAQPHRYRLLFAPPLPGYDAHSEPLVAASRRVMAVALDVYGGDPGGSAGDAHPEGPAPRRAGPDRPHGVVGLEVGGELRSPG